MNIVFVNGSRNKWGGIKTWMVQLAEFLKKRGHNVTVVCRRGDLLAVRCAKKNVRCIQKNFGIDYSPLTILWFMRLFGKEKTEAIITNISKEIRTAGVAAKLMGGIAHINRLGLRTDLKNSKKIELEYRFLINNVFVSCRDLYDYFNAKTFLQGKMRMFPNSAIPRPFKMTENSVVKFVSVANLCKRKQVDKIIEAFSNLRELPWEYHIGGFGSELDYLKNLVKERDLEGRIYFGGTVDPYEYLTDKDATILYPTYESIANSLLESMAMSCAVITTNVGGISELTVAGKNALIVEPDDLTSLTDAIRKLISDKNMLHTLKVNAHQTVSADFNQEVIFSNVEREIGQIIEQRNHS